MNARKEGKGRGRLIHHCKILQTLMDFPIRLKKFESGKFFECIVNSFWSKLVSFLFSKFHITLQISFA